MRAYCVVGRNFNNSCPVRHIRERRNCISDIIKSCRAIKAVRLLCRIFSSAIRTNNGFTSVFSVLLKRFRLFGLRFGLPFKIFRVQAFVSASIMKLVAISVMRSSANGANDYIVALNEFFTAYRTFFTGVNQ